MNKSGVIVLIEDDADDQELICTAFKSSVQKIKLYC